MWRDRMDPRLPAEGAVSTERVCLERVSDLVSESIPEEVDVPASLSLSGIIRGSIGSDT